MPFQVAAGGSEIKVLQAARNPLGFLGLCQMNTPSKVSLKEGHFTEGSREGSHLEQGSRVVSEQRNTTQGKVWESSFDLSGGRRSGRGLARQLLLLCPSGRYGRQCSQITHGSSQTWVTGETCILGNHVTKAGLFTLCMGAEMGATLESRPS